MAAYYESKYILNDETFVINASILCNSVCDLIDFIFALIYKLAACSQPFSKHLPPSRGYGNKNEDSKSRVVVLIIFVMPCR